MKTRFASLRTRLILLVVLALIPGFGLLQLNHLERRRHAVEEVAENAVRLVNLARSEQEAVIKNTRQLLVTLAQVSEVRSGNSEACSALLATIKASNPQYANIGTIGSDGNIYCSAVPLAQPVYVGDLSYYQRALATRNLAAGEFQIERVSSTPSISFAYPVLDESGAVTTIIYASLDLNWLSEMETSLELDGNAILFTFDRQGTVLAYFPDSEQRLGKPAPNASLIQAIQNEAGEGVLEAEASDGVARLYAYSPLGADLSLGAHVVIGIPTEVIYAESNRRLVRNIVGATVLALLFLGLALASANYLILRHAQTLANAARQLARGDLSARIALIGSTDELGQLAVAFNEMADSLQLRQNDARQQAARAQALVQTAARLNAQLSLDDVWNTICEEIANALDVSAVNVNLYDKKRDLFRTVASVGFPFTLPEIDQDNQEFQWALLEQHADRLGSTIMIPDLQAIPNIPLPPFVEQFDIRTIIYTPLARNDELIGGLSICTFGEVREFTEGELALLQGMADQAVQAAINAQLFEQAQERMRRLHALNAIDHAITGRRNLNDTLNVVLEQVTTQLQIDAADIFLFDKVTEELTLAVRHGFRTGLGADTRLAVGEGFGGRVVEKRQTICFPDLAAAEEEIHAPLLDEEGFASYCGVPLIAEGKIQGVLSVFSRTPLSPEAEWLEFLEALALQTAIAIDNSRLFDETLQLLEQTRVQAQEVQQIVDTMPEGVVLLNTQREVKMANLLGQQHLTVLANAQVGDAIDRMGNLSLDRLLEQRPGGRIWQELRARKAERTFEFAAQPIDHGSEVQSWVILLRDVTEERERQKYQQTQDRLATVGQLTAGIAHDFNNIMAVISIHSQTLSLRPEHPKGKEYLRNISTQAMRAADLIGQLLDFSRVSPLERSQLDLASFVKEIIKLLKRTLPENIVITLEADDDHYTVNADPTGLQQVLMNLAVNAQHAMPRGGKLQLTLRSLNLTAEQKPPLPDMGPGQYVCLSVADTGSGIPKDALAHIFEPFFTTKPRGEGTGLGLAQVHGIVKQHGGFISVDSVEGEGTVFTIYLPAVTSREGAAGEKANELDMTGFGGSETILLVEDNPYARAAVQDALSEMGYRVLEAENGKQALVVFEREQETINLILSDAIMPEMGGLDLYDQLEQTGVKVNFMIMSGYSPENRGDIEWIKKPFALKELAKKVRQQLNSNTLPD